MGAQRTECGREESETQSWSRQRVRRGIQRSETGGLDETPQDASTPGRSQSVRTEKLLS